METQQKRHEGKQSHHEHSGPVGEIHELDHKGLLQISIILSIFIIMFMVKKLYEWIADHKEKQLLKRAADKNGQNLLKNEDKELLKQKMMQLENSGFVNAWEEDYHGFTKNFKGLGCHTALNCPVRAKLERQDRESLEIRMSKMPGFGGMNQVTGLPTILVKSNTVVSLAGYRDSTTGVNMGLEKIAPNPRSSASVGNQLNLGRLSHLDSLPEMCSMFFSKHNNRADRLLDAANDRDDATRSRRCSHFSVCSDRLSVNRHGSICLNSNTVNSFKDADLIRSASYRLKSQLGLGEKIQK